MRKLVAADGSEVALPFTGHRNLTRPDGSTQDSWYEFVCGHCDREVSGAVVAAYYWHPDFDVKWLWCPGCSDGSVLAIDGEVYPGRALGPPIEGLPQGGAAEAYAEARRTMSVNAFTACELLCRNILMHVAVEKGAEEGQTFAQYIDYLASAGYVTPPMTSWVKLIKDHGNKSAHTIDPPDRTRAESTLMFTAELLRLTYEMEFMASKHGPTDGEARGGRAEESTTRAEG